MLLERFSSSNVRMGIWGLWTGAKGRAFKQVYYLKSKPKKPKTT